METSLIRLFCMPLDTEDDVQEFSKMALCSHEGCHWNLALK